MTASSPVCVASAVKVAFLGFEGHPCPVSDEFLTTGQAAVVLGVSRQRVVDLCERGRLPFVRVGSHRRLRRSDVEPFVRSALTRDQERSLWLHRVVAGRLAVDPDAVLATARANIAVIRDAHRGTSAERGIERWVGLLDGPLDRLADIVTSRSPDAVEMRQNSPFAGVVSQSDRTAALAAFRRHWRNERAA